jgi:Tol biopolymer transport system component
MKQDHDLRSALHRGADAIHIDPDEAFRTFERTARRRAVVRRATAIVTALLIAAFGLSIVWVLRPARPEHPQPTLGSEPTGTIAYMKFGDSGGSQQAQVFASAIGGGTPTPVGSDAFSIYPVWSHDGGRIAYGGGGDFDSTALTIANVDGSDARVIADRPIRGTISWSADDAKIAYVSDGPLGAGAVFVVNADGTDDHLVSKGWWQSVDWSPDGQRLLVAGHPQTADNAYTEEGYDIYIVRPDGTALTQLTNQGGYEHFARWSPDGTRILFVRSASYDDASYDSDLFVMRSDGTNVRRVTEWQGFDSFPTWSPDGSYIAFASDRDATPEQQLANRSNDAFANISIFVMRSDGSDVRRTVAAASGETLLPGSWMDGT